MRGGGVADGGLVHEQGVGAVDAGGAEGDHGAGAGPSEEADALRAEFRAGHEDGDGAQLGPGAGGLVAPGGGGAVLDDGVVEPAEGPLEFADEPAVERAEGCGRGGHEDHTAVSGAQAAGGGVGGRSRVRVRRRGRGGGWVR
ncbi:hypothetical protein GCM10020256_05060 [Streptomyces thermocoprophilus]